MPDQRYTELILRQVEGLLTAKEKQELESWLEASPKNKILAEGYARDFKSAQELPISVDTQKSFQDLKKRMKPIDAEKQRSIRLVPRSWLVAAGIALLVGYGLVFIFTKGSDLKTYGAQLENLEINLEDGSVVWLTPGSILSYAHGEKARQSHLQGKAFFDIAPNSAPFSIETSLAEVLVLGTSFEVEASAEITEVSVLTGTVELKRFQESVLIQQGQRMRATSDGLSEIEDHNSAIAAWRLDKLTFDNSTLEDGLRVIEQYYPLRFEIANDQLKNCKMNGTIGLENQSVLFQTLEAMLDVTIDSSNAIYTLTGSGCPTE